MKVNLIIRIEDHECDEQSIQMKVSNTETDALLKSKAFEAFHELVQEYVKAFKDE